MIPGGFIDRTRPDTRFIIYILTNAYIWCKIESTEELLQLNIRGKLIVR